MGVRWVAGGCAVGGLPVSCRRRGGGAAHGSGRLNRSAGPAVHRFAAVHQGLRDDCWALRRCGPRGRAGGFAVGAALLGGAAVGRRVCSLWRWPLGSWASGFAWRSSGRWLDGGVSGRGSVGVIFAEVVASANPCSGQRRVARVGVAVFGAGARGGSVSARRRSCWREPGACVGLVALPVRKCPRGRRWCRVRCRAWWRVWGGRFCRFSSRLGVRWGE